MRAAIVSLALIATLWMIACSAEAEGDATSGPRPGHRAHAGAPPMIPHKAFGLPCDACHGDKGREVEDVGYAPPSPHGATPGMSDARCVQCHLFQLTDDEFKTNTFEGAAPPAPHGHRAYPGAPPV